MGDWEGGRNEDVPAPRREHSRSANGRDDPRGSGVPALGWSSYKPYECQLGRAIPSNWQSDRSETAIRVQAQITDFS